MLEFLFLAATLVGVVLLRYRWPAIESYRRLPLTYPLGLMVWSLMALVVLSYTVPRLCGLSFHWGSLGKVATFGVLLVWPVALAPAPVSRLVAGTLVVLLTLLGLFDLIHVRHFGSLIPATAILSADQGWAVRESIASLFRWNDLWLLPTGMAGLVVATSAPAVSRPSRRNARILRVLVLVALLAGAGLVHHNLTSWRGQRILSHAGWARHVGVYGVHVIETTRAIGEALSRTELSPERLEAVRAYLAADRVARPVPGPEHELFGVARGSNVLVVQLEAVQRFVIGAQVRGVEITPFLNRLTETAAFYSRITDQSGESNTADTEYLVNNSLHPMRRGAVVFRRADNEFVAWPRLLADAGYTTLSAHPWDRGFWNRAVVHPKYGFERQLFRRELGGIRDHVGWGSSDAAFYEQMTPVLGGIERPFAAYLITLMSHHPYTFYPETRRVLDLGDLEQTMLGSYLHMMHEVDASLASFVDALEANGALDNTLLVVFGDHDARLQIPKATIEAGAHELGLPAEVIRQLGSCDPRVDFVPLFFRLPGGELHGTIDVAGGQIDIGATILFFLGIEQPQSFLGRPLLPDRKGFVARMDGSALDEQRDFVGQGVGVPGGGLCSNKDGAELPIAECGDLVERGEAQVQVSWEITEFNMASQL